MRIRNRVTASVEKGTAYCPAQQCVQGSWQPWQIADKGGTCYTPLIEEHAEDHVTPSFKKMIAAGAIINNPCYIVVKKTTYPPIVSLTHRTTTVINGQLTGYDWNGTYVPFSDVGSTPALLSLGDMSDFADVKASVVNEAVTSAHARINESEMLLGASVGEARETVDFLANTMHKSIRIYRNVRKLNLRALRKEISSNELAERYMEARYAVRPLIYDVNGVISALKKKREVIRKTYRGNASGRTQPCSDTITAPLFYETPCDVNRSVEYTVSARAGVLCNVEIDALTPWGVDKLAETVWELIPFSFIADWMVNVGDTIAANTPNSGVKELASWVSVKQTLKSTNSVAVVRSTAPANIWTLDNVSTCSSFSWGHEELILERFTQPIVSIYPQWKLKLDAWKLTDLGLIIRNIFR